MLYKRLNPDANPDNALQVGKNINLGCCLPDVQVCEYSIDLDKTAVVGATIDGITIDGTNYAFGTPIPKTDADADLLDKLRNELETIFGTTLTDQVYRKGPVMTVSAANTISFANFKSQYVLSAFYDDGANDIAITQSNCA